MNLGAPGHGEEPRLPSRALIPAHWDRSQVSIGDVVSRPHSHAPLPPASTQQGAATTMEPLKSH